MDDIIKYSQDIKQFGLTEYYHCDDSFYYIERDNISRSIPTFLTSDIMFYDYDINDYTPYKAVHYIKKFDDYIKNLKQSQQYDIPCISHSNSTITLPVDIWEEEKRIDFDLGYKIIYRLITPIKWYHHLISYGEQITADEFHKIIMNCVEQSLYRKNYYYNCIFIVHEQEADKYQILHLHDIFHEAYFGDDECLLSHYGSTIDVSHVADFIAKMRSGEVLLYKIYDHHN